MNYNGATIGKLHVDVILEMTVETSAITMDMSTKTGESGGTVSVNEAEGIVEAFVSGIGNRDSVGDIVMPGAFEKSFQNRVPRVVWGHDWNKPVGKVLEIKEVPPTDPRLPNKMKRANIGGVYVKVQFNLATQAGRDAFANVAFYGNDQEWSIGYKTHKSDYDPTKQANLLHEVELYEVSPVLHGANQLTGTVSIKSDDISVEQNWAEAQSSWSESEKTMGANPARGRGAFLARALAEVARGPVQVVRDMGDRVVFESGPGRVFMVSYDIRGGEVLFGKPRKVRMEMTFVPDEDDDKSEDVAEKSMHGEGYETEDQAVEAALRIGCTEIHESEGKFYPCGNRATMENAISGRTVDTESDLARSNQDGMKDAEIGCACGPECGCSGVKEDETPSMESMMNDTVRQIDEMKAALAQVVSRVNELHPVEEKVGALLLEMPDATEEQQSLISEGLANYNVTVEGKTILLGEGVNEPEMKAMVAEVLAKHGVSRVIAGRQPVVDQV